MEQFAAFLGNLTNRHNLARIAMVAIGGALLVGGLVALVRPAVAPAVTAATKATAVL